MKKSTARTVLAGLVPLVAGSALFWLSVRPCEPVAQANTGPAPSVWFDGVTVTPAPPEVDVESLPKVQAPRPLAHPAKTPAPASSHWTPPTPVCDWYPMNMGTIGSRVWYCK
jgi:hypothetical protein